MFGGNQISASIGLEAKLGEGGGVGNSVTLGLSEQGKVTTFEQKFYGSVGYGIASPVHGGVGGGKAGRARQLYSF